MSSRTNPTSHPRGGRDVAAVQSQPTEKAEFEWHFDVQGPALPRAQLILGCRIHQSWDRATFEFVCTYIPLRLRFAPGFGGRVRLRV